MDFSFENAVAIYVKERCRAEVGDFEEIFCIHMGSG